MLKLLLTCSCIAQIYFDKSKIDKLPKKTCYIAIPKFKKQIDILSLEASAISKDMRLNVLKKHEIAKNSNQIVSSACFDNGDDKVWLNLEKQTMSTS